MIEMMQELGKQYKSRPWGWMWVEGGRQPELEGNVEVGQCMGRCLGGVGWLLARACLVLGAAVGGLLPIDCVLLQC